MYCNGEILFVFQIMLAALKHCLPAGTALAFLGY
jgi:hypothetical protein